MKTEIRVVKNLQKVVNFFSKHLRFDKFLKSTGRKLAISIEDSIALYLFKQRQGIITKKSVYEMFKDKLKCSYKTLVVNFNRWAHLAASILFLILKINRQNQHIVKHIDSTGIPVCLFKNAKNHKTMKGLASYGKNSKGTYFGLKLHLIADLFRKTLSIRVTSANVDDRDVVMEISDEINGFLIADAGYVSQKLQEKFYQENKRILFVKPKKNMKKLMTDFQNFLYGTRMLIELNFRNLKLFYGLITSLPRSVNGYLANYIYSLLAYQIV